MPSPTQSDLDYLAAHPEVADKFKAHFGSLPEAPSRPKPTAYDVQYLVDNPQDLPKFEAHFGPINDLIPQKPQQQLSPMGQVADEAKFLGGRLANAAISIPGLPADLVGLGLKGMDYIGGRKTPTPNPLEAFSGNTIRGAAHDYGSQLVNAATGSNLTPEDLTPRDPTNLAEKFAGNVADFIGYGGRPNLRSATEAVTGAGAFTAAQEIAPDNPIVQLAAAYLGHRVPGNIASRGQTLFPAAKTFLRGDAAAGRTMQGDMQAYDRLSQMTGKPVSVMPGQLAGDYNQQQVLDAFLARSPGGQPEILKANESQAQLLDAAVKKIAESPTGAGKVSPTASGTGNKILDDFEASSQRFRDRQTQIEDYFQKSIGADTRVPMAETQMAIDKLKQAVKSDPKVAAIVSDKNIKAIEDAIKESGGTLSYSAARALKTDLGETLPKAGLLGDVKSGQLKLVYGALAKDIGSIAKQRGIGQAWDRYNQWATNHYTQSAKIFDRVAKAGATAPEKVAAQFANLDATAMKTALRNLTPEGRAHVAGFKLMEAAKSKAAGGAAEDVTTSYSKFLGNISEMKQDGTFDVVFGAPQFKPIRDVIADLETTSKSALKANKVAHDVSGAAAIRGGAAATIGLTALTGNIPAAAGLFAVTFIAPKYAAKLMMSKSYQSWLSSARTASPESAAALRQRLAMIAVRDRDPETREALKEFAAKYDEVLKQMQEKGQN